MPSPDTKPHPILAILGGAGPLAGVHIAQACMRAAGQQKRATLDADYPPLILFTQPIAGIGVRGIEDSEQARKGLDRLCLLAHQAGAERVLVACASAHALLENCASPLALPVVDWVSQQARHIAQVASRVGVLGSTSAMEDHVLARALEAHGVEAVRGNAPGAMDEVISHLMGGQCEPWAAQVLVRASEELMAQGCAGVWWGCTELGLVPEHLRPTHIRIFDTMDGMTLAALHAWGIAP